MASLYWSKLYLNKLISKDIQHLEQILHSEEYSDNSIEYLMTFKKLAEMKSPLVCYTVKHTHYSLSKICHILNLASVPDNHEKNGKIDLNHLEILISEHVVLRSHINIIIFANVGSTCFGAIDDIPRINILLKRKTKNGEISKYTIHADAALIGLALPIIRAFERVTNYFDEIGVTTMAISCHKLLGSVISGIVLSQKNILDAVFKDKQGISYVGSICDITISRCRPAMNVLTLHNILHAYELHIPESSLFERIIQTNLNNSMYLYWKLIYILGKDNVYLQNFHVFFKLNLENKDLIQSLINKYYLMPSVDGYVTIIVLQHLNKEKTECFITDLKNCFLNNE